MLNQRAVAPDVQVLDSVADAEDWLVQVEGILKQKLVDRRPAGVIRGTLRNSVLAKSLRIDIVRASGEQDTVDPGQQPGHMILALIEPYHNRRSSSGVQRALVVR